MRKIFTVLVLLIQAISSFGHHVITENLIAKESACVGNGCENDESFGHDTKRYKENNPQGTHYGLLTQEVQNVLPNLVVPFADHPTQLEQPYLSINYLQLLPFLVKSIQELSAEVKELRSQLTALQTN